MVNGKVPCFVGRFMLGKQKGVFREDSFFKMCVLSVKGPGSPGYEMHCRQRGNNITKSRGNKRGETSFYNHRV